MDSLVLDMIQTVIRLTAWGVLACGIGAIVYRGISK
jgi:L-cystine uptake protein TcyP (sodium:dicarboxylate symporter family)